MAQLYDTVKAVLNGTVPPTTYTIHFTDTWSGATVSGDVLWDGVSTSIPCNLSWEAYFIAHSMQGSPAGTHAIEAKAYDASSTLLQTYNFTLNVPSVGLPILALSAQMDAMTHDAIYAIDNGGDGSISIPSLLVQPAGTFTHLPSTGVTLYDMASSPNWMNPQIGVGPDKVYVLNNFYNVTTSQGDLEIASRNLGDTTSAWTHLDFLSDIISTGAGAIGKFLVDAAGGLWLGLQEISTNTCHIYYRAPGGTSWAEVWVGYRLDSLFFAGPKKTLPAFFCEGNLDGETGLPVGCQLGIWNGTTFTMMMSPDPIGQTWFQWTVAPVWALSASECWGYAYNPVDATNLDFYHLTDTGTDGPHTLACQDADGSELICGDTNIWPTSLGTAIIWSIGVGYTSPFYIGAVFDPVAMTLTPEILTPPGGDQFGDFPVTLLTAGTTFSNTAMESWMSETQDDYILASLIG